MRFVTIDGRGSRDLDDGIWVERSDAGWRVAVAIADAALAIEPESPWDLDARKRGATRYFATGNSPMLPRDLAEDRLSLLPRRGRHVIVARLDVSADLAARQLSLSLARCASVARLAYEDVPVILQRTRHPLQPMLRAAAELADALMAWRRDRGALAIYDLTAGWLTTEEGQLKLCDRREDTIGQVIVQELMILANSAVAEYAIAADLPLIFRNHQARAAAPDRAEMLRAIEDARLAPSTAIEAFRDRARLLLDRARYGADVRGHFGLNLPAYLHFTSPIRRYADLVNHQQLRAHLRADPIPRTREELAAIAAALNDLVDEERWAAHEHFKAKADQDAARLISTRRLEGATAKHFERAIKVELRGAQGPSEALAEAFRSRLQLGRAPLVCQALVLSARGDERWRPVQAATVAALVSRPADAVSVLAMLPQLAGWPSARFEESSGGAAHARTFRCVAALADGSTQAEGRGRTAKAARAAAAVSILAAACGVPTPRMSEAARPCGVDVGQSPVSILMEKAQAEGEDPPAFSFDMEGAAHAPVARCVCRYGGAEARGEGPSKREAKVRAAATMLAALATDGGGGDGGSDREAIPAV